MESEGESNVKTADRPKNAIPGAKGHRFVTIDTFFNRALEQQCEDQGQADKKEGDGRGESAPGGKL